ncbi:hypothetical protein Tco_0431961 [Tanacetum coccineum]
MGTRNSSWLILFILRDIFLYTFGWLVISPSFSFIFRVDSFKGFFLIRSTRLHCAIIHLPVVFLVLFFLYSNEEDGVDVFSDEIAFLNLSILLVCLIAKTLRIVVEGAVRDRTVRLKPVRCHQDCFAQVTYEQDELPLSARLDFQARRDNGQIADLLPIQGIKPLVESLFNKFKEDKVKGIWLDGVLIQREEGMQHSLRRKFCLFKHILRMLMTLTNDISLAKAVLMANLLSCDSDVLSKVPYFDTFQNDMINQGVQELQYSEQSPIVDYPDNEITSYSNIIPYS